MNTIDVPRSTFGNNAAELIAENVKIYLQIKNAFDQVDPEIKESITELTEICNAADATADEKQRALLTIVEALFPSLATDFYDSCQNVRQSASAVAHREQMALEEADFASRVEAIMREQEITQDELSTRIGVSQPAISNLLARKCRPQRRTVAKIAAALGVPPVDIWPGYSE